MWMWTLAAAAQGGTLTVAYDGRELTFETAVCEKAFFQANTPEEDLTIQAWATPDGDGMVLVSLEVDARRSTEEGSWRHHSENTVLVSPEERHRLVRNGGGAVEVAASGFGTEPGHCLMREAAGRTRGGSRTR